MRGSPTRSATAGGGSSRPSRLRRGLLCACTVAASVLRPESTYAAMRHAEAGDDGARHERPVGRVVRLSCATTTVAIIASTSTRCHVFLARNACTSDC
jgi:hypothetical protein